MTEKNKNINLENTNTTLDYTSEKSLLIKDNSSDFYSSKDSSEKNISDDINFNSTNQENKDNYDDRSTEESTEKTKLELHNIYLESNSDIIIETESENDDDDDDEDDVDENVNENVNENENGNENDNENSCSVTTIENIENIEDKINNIIYKFQITTDSIDDNEMSDRINNDNYDDNYKFDKQVEKGPLNDKSNTQNDSNLMSENSNDYHIQEFEFDSERFKTDSLYQEYIKTYYPEYYNEEQTSTSSINDAINYEVDQYKSKIYIDIHNQIPKKTNKTEYEIIQKVILDTLEKKNTLKKFENEKIHRLRKQQEHVLGKLDENVNHLEPNPIDSNDVNKQKKSQNPFFNQKQYAKLIPALKMPVTPTSNNSNYNYNYNKNIFVKKVSSNNSNSNLNKQKLTSNILQQNKINTQSYKRKLELLRNSQIHEFEFKKVNNKNDSATSSSKNYMSDEMKHEINEYNNKVILEKFLKAKNTSNTNENSQINQIFLDKNHEKYHATDNEKMLYLDDEYMKFQGWINNYIDNVKNQSKNIRNENLQPLPLNLKNKNIRVDSIRQKNKTIFANPNIDHSARKSVPIVQEQNYMKGSSRFIQMKNKKIFD
jgi:hypothetical protein